MRRFGSLAQRIAVAIPGIGLFIAVALLDSTPLTVCFSALLAFLGGMEMVGLLHSEASAPLRTAGGLLASGATVSVILLPSSLAMPLLLVPGAILACCWMMAGGPSEAPGRLMGSIGAMAVIAVGFGLLARLRMDWPTPWVFFLPLFICWAGDSAAYFVGSAFGRHKMAPSVSPAKSWEGFAAGLLGATGGAIAAGTLGARLPVLPMMIAGIAGGIAGVAGDLLESSLKRTAGVKDSGRLLPGHGGVLDRFDSILATVPTVWIVLSLAGLEGTV